MFQEVMTVRETITVQIMAGGKSRRMGRDKAAVELGGRTLLERALDTWQGFGAAVQLSVGPAERGVLAPEGVRAVADVYPGRGPLGGLHAGLLACDTELLLLAAVDTPFVTKELAEALAEAAEAIPGDAYVYTVEGRPQPLFALYRKSCLPAAESLLEAGENRMGQLLSRVGTVCLPGEGKEHCFVNLNTPEDVERAREALRPTL